jgi:hypothetical protein
MRQGGLGINALTWIARHVPAETQLYVPRIEATLLKREGKAGGSLHFVFHFARDFSSGDKVEEQSVEEQSEMANLPLCLSLCRKLRKGKQSGGAKCGGAK